MEIDDYSSNDEETSQLEQLQYMLMSINSNLIQEISSFIQVYFSISAEKCRQLAHQLLLPIKFHSNSFSHIIKLILSLINSSTINGTLYLLPKFLLSAISQEITTDSIIPYQNSIQGFLYQCYESQIFDIGDIISILKICHDQFSLFNESICSLFCWFAPEIEKYDSSFFADCLESFHFHLQYTEFKSVYQKILDDFDRLRENDWQLFKRNRQTSEYFDPIFQAIKKDEVHLLQKLIYKFPEVDFDHRYDVSPFETSWIMKYKPTGIQIAAFFGSVRCFKFFVLQKADPHKKAGCVGCFGGSSYFTEMPLTYFAIAGGNSEIIHLTEQLGCDFLSDVLFSSVVFHRYEVFEWLVATKSCDYDVRDPNGDSIHHLAILSDNIKVLKYLSENGQLTNQVDEFQMSLVHYAAKYGNFVVLDFLISGRKCQCQTFCDDNFFNQNIKFDVNSVDDELMTPIHYAVKYRRYEAASVLLSHPDINVNAKNSNGWTPLHFAVSSQNAEMVKLLLSHRKIDPNIKNNSRISPYELASKMRLEEIKNIFALSRSNRNSSVRKRPSTSVSSRFDNGRNNNQNDNNVKNRLSAMSPIYSFRKNRPSTTLRQTRRKDKILPSSIIESSDKKNSKETVVKFQIREKPRLKVPMQKNRLGQGMEKRISKTASGSRINQFTSVPNFPRKEKFADFS